MNYVIEKWMATNCIGDMHSHRSYTEKEIPMSYTDNAKEKADIAKKIWDEKMKQDPALEKIAQEFFKPPTKEEQAVLDKLAQEVLKDLKRGS